MGNYFQTNADKFDPSSKEDESYILNHSDGYKAKFSFYKATLTVFEHKLFNVILYVISWMVKLFSLNILRVAKRTKKITRK